MPAMTNSQALILTHCLAHCCSSQPSCRVDYYSATDRPKYIGLAPSGAAESDATWRIIKCNYNGDELLVDVKVAHCVTWTDRANAPYA